MATATKVRSKAKSTKKTSKPKAQKPSPAEAPVHVVGKPAEVEPAEYRAVSAEAPEAAMMSAEAPDAGYGRCTESSDWENRGRS